jgi:hypothetical protein
MRLRGSRVHGALLRREAVMPSRPDQALRDAVQRSDEKLAPPPALTGAEVEERGMMRCIMKHERNSNCNVGANWQYPLDKLEQAYEKCAYITEHYAKTFYLGTQLMTPEKARAVCAIYVWCRRTDELVDGPNADRITPEVRSRMYGTSRLFTWLCCTCVAVYLTRLRCRATVLRCSGTTKPAETYFLLDGPYHAHRAPQEM